MVLLVIFIVHLALGGNAANAGQNGTRAGTGPSGSTQPAASKGPVIPAGFNGTWSGQVSQPPSDTYHVTVSLVTAQSTGAISYTGAGATCSGALTLTSVSATKMIMKLGTEQKGCANSTVTITLIGPNALTFSEGNPAASGTLTRG